MKPTPRDVERAREWFLSLDAYEDCRCPIFTLEQLGALLAQAREEGRRVGIEDAYRHMKRRWWHTIIQQDVMDDLLTLLEPKTSDGERDQESVVPSPESHAQPGSIQPLSRGGGSEEPRTTSRCQRCGWTLADSPENGCVPGNCSYRCNCSSYAHEPECLLAPKTEEKGR